MRRSLRSRLAEMVLGTTPTAKHDSLYASYLLQRDRGWEAIGDMIVADIRSSLELGTLKPAADLLIVLRRFLLERLKVAPVRSHYASARIISFPSSALKLRVGQDRFAPIRLRHAPTIYRDAVAIICVAAMRQKQTVAHLADTPRSLRSLRAFTRRQGYVHGSTLAVAFPLDLAAELLGEAVDQPAPEPGIGVSRIAPLAVVGYRQPKLPGHPL